jgi:hypothetical protein
MSENGIELLEHILELTYKEIGVLIYVCEGLTNEQVGINRNISSHNVSFHLGKVYEKLRIPDKPSPKEKRQDLLDIAYPYIHQLFRQYLESDPHRLEPDFYTFEDIDNFIDDWYEFRSIAERSIEERIVEAEERAKQKVEEEHQQDIHDKEDQIQELEVDKQKLQNQLFELKVSLEKDLKRWDQEEAKRSEEIDRLKASREADQNKWKVEEAEWLKEINKLRVEKELTEEAQKIADEERLLHEQELLNKIQELDKFKEKSEKRWIQAEAELKRITDELKNEKVWTAELKRLAEEEIWKRDEILQQYQDRIKGLEEELETLRESPTDEIINERIREAREAEERSIMETFVPPPEEAIAPVVTPAPIPAPAPPQTWRNIRTLILIAVIVFGVYQVYRNIDFPEVNIGNILDRLPSLPTSPPNTPRSTPHPSLALPQELAGEVGNMKYYEVSEGIDPEFRVEGDRLEPIYIFEGGYPFALASTGTTWLYLGDNSWKDYSIRASIFDSDKDYDGSVSFRRSENCLIKLDFQGDLFVVTGTGEEHLISEDKLSTPPGTFTTVAIKIVDDNINLVLGSKSSTHTIPQQYSKLCATGGIIIELTGNTGLSSVTVRHGP